LLHERRDVGLERERDDVGVEPGGDGSALLTGGAVGLGERNAVPGRGLLEGRDQLSVRILGRRVGDEGEFRVLRGTGRKGWQKQGGEQSQANSSHRLSL